jgi:hypothetical protein
MEIEDDAFYSIAKEVTLRKIQILCCVGMMLCSCSNKSSINGDYFSESSSSIHAVRKPKRSISTEGDTFYLDTGVLLNNDNLPRLLKKLKHSKSTEYSDVGKIPDVVQQFLEHISEGLEIANPGEDWQHGCVVPVEFDEDHPTTMDTVLTDSGIQILYTFSTKPVNLPRRSLQHLSISDDLVLMTYLSGGMGVSDHLIIIEYNDSLVTDFWHCNTLSSLKTEEDIIRFLEWSSEKGDLRL